MTINYSYGKIYRIICDQSKLQYIGSTTQPLSMRLAQHKIAYKRCLNGKGFNRETSSVFQVLKNNTAQIYLLEEFSCENKEQLLQRERYWIEKETCVNKVCPIRTQEEHKERKKEYTKENKEYFSDLSKERYRTKVENKKSKCECGSIVINLQAHFQTDVHRAYMAKRTSNEPLVIEAVETDLKEASEIRTLTRAETPYDYRQICECGAVLSDKSALEEHLKTQRHLNLMKEKEERLNPTPKPEPFKEFTCECGMVIKKLWNVKPHLQSKKHLDDIRKKENFKLIKCICGAEIRGEHRYQQHIVSEVHKSLLRKRGIEVKTEEEKSIDPEFETETISTEEEIKYEVDPEIEPEFLLIEETDPDVETLTINIQPISDPITDITKSFRDMNLTKEERTDRNKARSKEKLKCVCGGEYSRSCHARHRESKTHKDFIEAHPEHAEPEAKSGITCECGAIIGSGEKNLARHQSSNKHIKYMEAIRSGKTIEEFIQEEKDKVKAKDKAKKSKSILCECGTSYTKQHENRHNHTKRHIDFINNNKITL